MAKNKTINGTNGNSANLGFETEMWRAADALRPNMDAAEYNHVVLELIFLKYISDAFEEKHAELEADRKSGAAPEDPDEYRAANIFWVPPEARRQYLRGRAKDPKIGKIDHHKLIEHASTVGTPGIGSPLTSLRSIEVSVPPLREQQAIARILGALDDKIALNRRRNRTLEALARAIFQSGFVDFDPVKAKAAGDQPPGLKPELAALFPDRLEDSPLGPISAGWHVGTVGDHFTLTMGQSPPGSTYNKDGDDLPFHQGRTDFGFRFPTGRVYCTAPTRLAKPGDTLVSVRAPVGDVNIANEECVVDRGVAAVRHKSRSRSLTYHAMQDLGDHFVKFEAERTIFGSINKAAFEKLPFVAASNEVIAACDHVGGPLDDEVEVLERETAILAALRDALLPNLISGELRVTDAERIVERAT